MRRDLLQALEHWKTSQLRKPLIIRGARQVGKTWLVDSFGECFKHYAKINFERDEYAHQFFLKDLDPTQIIENLAIYTKTPIIPGETLLFLDEIQECERAITALRYFKEEMPEIHVIAAGSLLDFAIERVGVPVGRVQFLYLHPISFQEFLIAIDQEELCQHINRMTISPVFHQQLLGFVKTYCWIGGMPEVVDSWIKHRDVQLCATIQETIIRAYQQDFEKYARKAQIEHVDKVFNAIPLQLGKKFIYSHVDPHMRSSALKEALSLLEKAGIAHKAYHTSAQGLPLAGQTNLQRFKVFMFDIGLSQRLLGVDARDWLLQPLAVSHIGPIMEQYVAQQYIATQSISQPPALYYWHREHPKSNAEVDFVFVKDGTIVPVEVKSGKKGHLKSLNIFLEGHPHSTCGIKISEQAFQDHAQIKSIPFYAIAAWLSFN